MDRIHSLTMKTIKQKKVIRLSRQAAIIRHMKPFGQALADELCDPSVTEEAAMRQAMFHLSQCYLCLRSGSLKGDFLNEQSIELSL
eukprot:6760787-Pyramimonas_sp.AAC.1